MIELVSDERCIDCDICVRVCPTNVFDAVPDEAPVIARQDECQTCFMCELYCPTNALYVAPDADVSVEVTEAQLGAGGKLGSYRTAIGWDASGRAGAAGDQSFRLLPHAQPQKPASTPA